MPDQEVFRKESKRWVAPKTSYDGDEWGTDEYEEYEREGIAEEDEEQEYDEYEHPAEAAQSRTEASEESAAEPRVATTPAQSGTRPIPARLPVAEAPQEKMAANHGAASAREAPKQEISPSGQLSEGGSATTTTRSKQEAAEPSGESPTPSKPQNAGSADVSAETPNDEEDYDNSIQDIYGFYENRYSVHPYNAMLNSSQSGSQNDLNSSDAAGGAAVTEAGAANPLSHEEHAATHEQIQGAGEGPAESAEPEAAPVPKVAFHPTEKVSALNIRKGHSRESTLESLPSDKAINDSVTSHERPYSQAFDADIAELYQGSSEFLNRPISTYNPLPPRDISDESIKDLLTPRIDQEGFAPQDTNAVPPLFITSASPDSAKSTQPLQTVSTESGHAPVAPSAGAGTAGAGNERVERPGAAFERDFDYVDGPSDGGAAGSDEDNDSEDAETDNASLEGAGSTKAKAHDTHTHSRELDEAPSNDRAPGPAAAEPFILPSERNRLTTAAAALPTSSLDASSSLDGHRDSEPQRSPNTNLHDHTKSDHTKSDHSKSDHVDRLSDSYLDSHSNKHHSYRSSEASGVSDATSLTASSVQTDTLEDSKDFENHDRHDGHGLLGGAQAASPRSSGHIPSSSGSEGTFATDAGFSQSAAKPQPIAAKVKRPPQVDFTALLNKSGTSSESRCEQMRILRMREAEYSSGLETWLVTTLTQVDPSAKIFTDGVPPTDANNTLDLPTTAKVSNAMHSSATNTKEKLGKVGEKSKSFFAKVIR